MENNREPIYRRPDMNQIIADALAAQMIVEEVILEEEPEDAV
jgi:hypothetical protein